MSKRQEDFEKGAMDYCEDHSHCIYFEAGAEHGYQYAVDKACEWLRNNLEYYLGDYNLAEDELEDNKVHYAAMLEELRNTMEE